MKHDSRHITILFFFESERLSRLIANVLQLARLTNHDVPLDLKEYTLHDLLEVVRSKVSTQADAAGFTSRFLTAGEAQALTASPSNVYLDLYLLGQDFRSGDVAAVFVCRS
jgi:hypothetical protein